MGMAHPDLCVSMLATLYQYHFHYNFYPLSLLLQVTEIVHIESGALFILGMVYYVSL